MPIEPNVNVTSPSPSSTVVSAIENEIPAYRAISPAAVVALVLGLLSVLSFASWYFLVLAAAAVLIGFAADRKIQKVPDILTGRGMAQAGVGLGLIFGLTSLSVTGVQTVLRAREARWAARSYEAVLNKGTLNDAVWYGQHPEIRERTTPDKLVEELSKGRSPNTFAERNSALIQVKKAMSEPHADLHFDRIEKHGVEEIVPFAAAVFKLHTPEAKNPDDRERSILAVIRWSPSRKRRNDWWVTEFVFPYKENSFRGPARETKADDGHGHSHLTDD